LKQVLALPHPAFTPPSSSGANDAAAILASYLTKSGP
jgi:hypothetical protein